MWQQRCGPPPRACIFPFNSMVPRTSAYIPCFLTAPAHRNKPEEDLRKHRLWKCRGFQEATRFVAETPVIPRNCLNPPTVIFSWLTDGKSLYSSGSQKCGLGILESWRPSPFRRSPGQNYFMIVTHYLCCSCSFSPEAPTHVVSQQTEYRSRCGHPADFYKARP